MITTKHQPKGKGPDEQSEEHLSLTREFSVSINRKMVGIFQVKPKKNTVNIGGWAASGRFDIVG
jgi:hypothetical protein